MNHSSVHDPAHDALPVLTQLEGDAHRLVGVPLELNQPDPGYVLDLGHAVAVGAVQAPSQAAVVHKRGQAGSNGACRRRGHPNRILPVDLVGYDVMALE